MNRLNCFLMILLLLVLINFVPAESTFQNPKIVSNENFQISYDDSEYVFVYPFEHSIDRIIKITNLKNVQQNIMVKITIGLNGRDEESPAWPQPWDKNFLANETKEIFLKQEWFSEITSTFVDKNTYSFTFSVKAWIEEINNSNLEVQLPNYVRVDALENNATNLATNSELIGIITDKDTNQPVSARVSVNANWPRVNYQTSTNSEGLFKLKFPAYKQRYLGNWLPYSVTITANGYETYNLSVSPKENELMHREIKLIKAKETANYSLKSKYDTQLPTARVAFSKDGNYFATVPFHSSLKASEIQSKANLHLFDTRGNLICKYKLDNEIPSVSITDDASLIATIHRPVTDNWDGGDYVVVINKKCEEVLRFENLQINGMGPSEVQISSSGKYLAVGTWDGRLYLADINQKKTLWSTNLHNGQVRFMLFDDENGVYVGSDPYLFYYSIKGELKWKVNIASWPYSIALSENYLFVGPKVGTRLTLINRSDGTIAWTYPIPARPDTMLISPDEEYFIYQCSNGNMALNNAFFNQKGEVLFNLRTANSGAITKDSEYIAYYGGGSVHLVNRRGHELWNTQLDPEKWPAPRGGVFISEDKKRIIVADAVNGYVYYFEGGIEDYSQNNENGENKFPSQNTNNNNNNSPFSNEQTDYSINQCKGIFDAILNFISMLFGNKICN